MDPNRLVRIRTYLSSVDAELARATLEAAGIDCLVRADDCAGLRPHLQIGGVELLVRAEDVQEAGDLLGDEGPARYGADG
jgi:Putative prokaryotic signal transducing protein